MPKQCRKELDGDVRIITAQGNQTFKLISENKSVPCTGRARDANAICRTGPPEKTREQRISIVWIQEYRNNMPVYAGTSLTRI
jgi:hypothetical protein